MALLWCPIYFGDDNYSIFYFCRTIWHNEGSTKYFITNKINLIDIFYLPVS